MQPPARDTRRSSRASPPARITTSTSSRTASPPPLSSSAPEKTCSRTAAWRPGMPSPDRAGAPRSPTAGTGGRSIPGRPRARTIPTISPSRRTVRQPRPLPPSRTGSTARVWTKAGGAATAESTRPCPDSRPANTTCRHGSPGFSTPPPFTTGILSRSSPATARTPLASRHRAQPSSASIAPDPRAHGSSLPER